GRTAASARSDEVAEQGRQSIGPVAERLDVQANGNEHGFVAEERGVEEREAFLRGQRIDALARHARAVRLAQARGHCTARGPHAPSERGGRKADCAAMAGERVEECIGSGVVRLSPGAEYASG